MVRGGGNNKTASASLVVTFMSNLVGTPLESEQSIIQLAQSHARNEDPKALAQLVIDSRIVLQSLAKAKTAKLITTLLDLFATIPNSGEQLVNITLDNIEWAKGEKRIFLKQNLETRLVALLVHLSSLPLRKIYS